jgi:hypothetical protein
MENGKQEEKAKIVISEGSEGGNPGMPVHLIAPSLVLTMPIVPTALSFNVAVLTYGIDFSVPHLIVLTITTFKDGNPKVVSRIESKLPSFDQVPNTKGMVFNFAVRNAVFYEEGKNEVSFSIDGKNVITDNFWTVKQVVPDE